MLEEEKRGLINEESDMLVQLTFSGVLFLLLTQSSGDELSEDDDFSKNNGKF